LITGLIVSLCEEQSVAQVLGGGPVVVYGGSPCWNRTIHPAAQWRRCHPEPNVKKEGIDMTIVSASRPVTGGVDTHLELNVAAGLDRIGGLLGVESFPTTVKGNEQLLKWMAGFGPVARVGVEGTSS
jgi:hypothetical protein